MEKFSVYLKDKISKYNFQQVRIKLIALDKWLFLDDFKGSVREKLKGKYAYGEK